MAGMNSVSAIFAKFCKLNAHAVLFILGYCVHGYGFVGS